jgi:hypothetical protein
VAAVAATVLLDCPVCGPYEITTGAIGYLRANGQMRAAIRAEIRRQLDSGVERPQINLEVIKALTGR